LYLSPLAGQPASVLDRWEQELSGFAGDDSATGRTWDYLLRYCRTVDLDAPAAATFLSCYHNSIEKVLQAGLSADEARAEDRERVRCWVDEHEALAERLECGPRFVDSIRDFVHVLKDKLLTPWDRALRERRFFFIRRKAVHVTLSSAERLAIPTEEIAASLQRMAEAVSKCGSVRRRRAADCENALTRWQAWHAGRCWLAALAELETAALGQRRDLEAACDAWDQEWSAVVDKLRDFLAKVNTLLAAFEPLRSVDPPPDEMIVRLTRGQREAVDLQLAKEVTDWLQRNWPPPADKVEACFALWALGMG
jgi:hypothetical protein